MRKKMRKKMENQNNQPNNKNKLFCILGQSASGKSTIVDLLLKEIDKQNLNIKQIQSSTTRKPREGELQDVDYHFTDLHTFDTLYKQGKIVEYATYKVNNETWLYFTTKEQMKVLEKSNSIKIVNPVGLAQLKPYKKQIVTIYIDCPDDIREQRYKKRGSTTHKWENRKAKDDEDFKYLKCDYTVLNDGSRTLEQVMQEVIDIIKKEVI